VQQAGGGSTTTNRTKKRKEVVLSVGKTQEDECKVLDSKEKGEERHRTRKKVDNWGKQI